MGETTGIAWCDHTFNPWWGCVRVSPGCGLGKSVGGCYAESFAKRYGHDVWGVNAPRRLFGDKHWSEPRKWNAAARRDGVRRRAFCASMADVFEDRRDLDEPRARLWALIEETPDLDWLLLTKRPEHMRALAPARWEDEWPSNVWAGSTMESQHYYNARWPVLALVPAHVRFVSHEPAIGPLRLAPALDENDLESYPDWVITGGESGGGPRPYDTAWAEDLINQTRALADVSLFVKQLGAHAIVADDAPDHHPAGRRRLPLVERAGANPAEWPAHLRVREFPEARP